MQQFPVKALPSVPTVRLNPGQRSLGRLTDIHLAARPEGPAQQDLAGDLFFESYLSHPEAAPTVPPERSINRELINWLKSTHGWEKTRASTTGNMPASMMAAALMWSHLSNEETIQEALKRQEEAAATTQRARAHQMAANALKQAAEESGDHLTASQAAHRQAIADQAREWAEKQAAEAMQMIQEAQTKPLKQAAMAAIAQAAVKETKEIAEAAAGWGMGPGSLIQSDPAAAMAFLKHNTGKIAQIARLAGRMRGFALQARQERAPAGVVPAGVGLTRDLTRVFPTELAMLRPDAPELLRAMKVGEFASRGLLGYTPAGDAQRRGPFVGAVDVSPSMRIRGGAPEIVAKAVALGISQVAQMESRPYSLFAFASDRNAVTAVTNEGDWPAHLAWASSSQGGGTDFDMALDLTLRHLRELGKKANGADALFISDGEAGVSDQMRYTWKSFAMDTGARLFYVPVGRGGRPEIEELADRVVEIAELDEQTGANLAAELGRWFR